MQRLVDVSPPPPPDRRRSLWLVAVIGVVLAMILSGLVWQTREQGVTSRPAPRRPSVEAYALPKDQSLVDAPDEAPLSDDDPSRVEPQEVLEPAVVLPELKAGTISLADVKAFGAVGDGTVNDSNAIQRANDDIAARGGGRVFFPAGRYLASNVVQDSRVEFVGAVGAVLKHPDGTSREPIVKSRVRETEGTIERGSSTLKVANATGIEPGSPIAIRAAGGASAVQNAALAVATTPSDRALTLGTARGFGYGRNFVLIGSEVAAYGRVHDQRLEDVERGLFGSKATVHTRGELVYQLRVLYAKVKAVSGTVVTLDRRAALGVEGAAVFTGSQRLSIRGLTFDGNRKLGTSSTGNSIPIQYELARLAAITSCTLRNGDHGAIMFDRGTSESLIRGNAVSDTGDPDNHLGSSIWLFRGASRNTVEDNVIGGDSYLGITIDDRTVGSSEWDEDARGNQILSNRITIPPVFANSGITVSNSTENVVASNKVVRTIHGVEVLSDSQGMHPLVAQRNVVRGNALDRNDVGLYVTGSRNNFSENAIDALRRPIVDKGRDNSFEANMS